MKFRLTSEYGALEQVRDGVHNGVDLAMPMHTKLRTITDGIVTKVDKFGHTPIGNEVVIKDDNGISHIYGHMSKINVLEGEHVDRGELIGYSGNSGNSTGPHLHYGEVANGHFIDPSKDINDVANLAGSNPIGIFDIQGHFENLIWSFLHALQHVALQIIDSASLIGGGVLILLSVAGLKNSKHYIWILIVARIILKFALGGYLN